MRQYVVDELRKNEIERVEQYLSRTCQEGGVNRLYWLPIPDDLLSEEQAKHVKDCGPHCIGIEITEDSVVFEMLVRSRKKLRCSCITYASEQQRNFILQFADRLVRETEVGA